MNENNPAHAPITVLACKAVIADPIQAVKTIHALRAEVERLKALGDKFAWEESLPEDHWKVRAEKAEAELSDFRSFTFRYADYWGAYEQRKQAALDAAKGGKP